MGGGVLRDAEGPKPRLGRGVPCHSPLCHRTAWFERRGGAGRKESTGETRERSVIQLVQGAETLS